MKTKIERQWDAFDSSESKKSGIFLKIYSAKMILDGIIALRLPDKTRCIAFRVSSKNLDIKSLNSLTEIQCELIDDESFPGKYLLLFNLLDDSLVSIFAVLCEDLFNCVFQVEKEDELIRNIKNRFIKWKELFSLAKEGGLSKEAQLGLYGELILLKNLLKHTKKPVDCLSVWTGPESGIRDFEYNNNAIEVKTSQGHNHQKVTISSERQLDTSLINNLYLFHLSVERRNSEENTLNHLIEGIICILEENEEAKLNFKKKLCMVGWFEHQKKLYCKISYFIRSENYYHVSHDFPRIEEKDLRRGVGDVRYSIILSSLTEPYTANLNNIIEKLDLL